MSACRPRVDRRTRNFLGVRSWLQGQILLEELHGYDIARLIETRSKGALTFHAASLYPLLYRLERRGWITGRWLEQAGARRRRMYRITAAGRRVLEAHRTSWEAFVRAVNLVTGHDHA